MLLVRPNVNIVKVIDALEYALKQVKPPNFLTGPYVVDRAHDPRTFKQDKLAEYRRLGAMVSIKSGDAILLDKNSEGNRGTMAGAVRKRHVIEIMCTMTISKAEDDANITIDDLLGACLHDIEWGVIRGGFVQSASVALNAADYSWGQAPSCINPKIVKVMAFPTKHPSGYQNLGFQYEFDEFYPRGDGGRY